MAGVAKLFPLGMPELKLMVGHGLKANKFKPIYDS